MQIDDRQYYLRRAEAELEMAQKAFDERVVRTHYHMANRYLDLVYGQEDQASDEQPSSSHASFIFDGKIEPHHPVRSEPNDSRRAG